jgi:hypothetical protein
MYTWGVLVFVEKFSAKKISQILRISPVLRNLSLTRLDSVYSFSNNLQGLCYGAHFVKQGEGEI